ncbi:Glycosyl transferase [Operophtera brumata]|uniref:Glycosyl transferase n=1 Tax=Operophtera brumata TaxID=104452 RepID=A0A0L7LLS8_OPEBR|nr:Glycosyl transferase [Operophtera brumata]
MKTGHHDILLIPEPGAPGTFIGVPNVIKDPDNSPSKHTVPTFKFFIKLVEEGRYLLMIDCKASAVASLSAKEIPKKKDDLEFVVSKLPLGIGNFSCAFI